MADRCDRFDRYDRHLHQTGGEVSRRDCAAATPRRFPTELSKSVCTSFNRLGAPASTSESSLSLSLRQVTGSSLWLLVPGFDCGTRAWYPPTSGSRPDDILVEFNSGTCWCHFGSCHFRHSPPPDNAGQERFSAFADCALSRSTPSPPPPRQVGSVLGEPSSEDPWPMIPVLSARFSCRCVP